MAEEGQTKTKLLRPDQAVSLFAGRAQEVIRESEQLIEQLTSDQHEPADLDDVCIALLRLQAQLARQHSELVSLLVGGLLGAIQGLPDGLHALLIKRELQQRGGGLIT